MQDFPRRRSAGPPVRTCSSPDTLPAIMLCRSNSTANLPAVWPLRLPIRSEEHTSELQSRFDLVCRLLLEKNNFTPWFLDRAGVATAEGLRITTGRSVELMARLHPVPRMAVSCSGVCLHGESV